MHAGPVLSGRADGVSKETVTSILEGKKGSIMPWVVDVRDIGRAHVLGIEVRLTPWPQVLLGKHYLGCSHSSDSSVSSGEALNIHLCKASGIAVCIAAAALLHSIRTCGSFCSP